MVMIIMKQMGFVDQWKMIVVNDELYEMMKNSDLNNSIDFDQKSLMQLPFNCCGCLPT